MWVKICGIRDLETALEIASLRVDAIGLNFYAPSPRAITPDRAAEIIRQLPASTTPIGLFVNHSLEQVRQIARHTGLQTLQIHGDEPPEFLAELSEFDLIRAFRIRNGDLAPVRETLLRYRQLGVTLKACLLDAYQPGAFGGTGQTIDWEALAPQLESLEIPVILAGGLNPENVREAIRTLHPWGVDTAGGVESAPGLKDLALVRAFLSQSRSES